MHCILSRLLIYFVTNCIIISFPGTKLVIACMSQQLAGMIHDKLITW